MELRRDQIPYDTIDFIWCSFPCQCFSYAAGYFHFKYGEPKSAQAHHMLKLLKCTLKLISECKPRLYFIENPRGQLRYIKTLVDWLVKNDGMTKELTYSSYGFPTTKPTNLFTNAHGFRPLALMNYGRGAKNPLDVFNKMTTDQRQKVPRPLIQAIIDYAEKSSRHFTGMYPGLSHESILDIAALPRKTA